MKKIEMWKVYYSFLSDPDTWYCVVLCAVSLKSALTSFNLMKRSWLPCNVNAIIPGGIDLDSSKFDKENPTDPVFHIF